MLGSPNAEKSGANENLHHGDAGRLPRNRWFESGSLQRRVRDEPLPPSALERRFEKAGPMVRIQFPPPESLRTIGPSTLVAAQPPRGGKAPSVTTIAIENALLVKRWHSTRWHLSTGVSRLV